MNVSLLTPDQFRQALIRGVEQPATHYLIHRDFTDNEPRPRCHDPSNVGEHPGVVLRRKVQKKIARVDLIS